MARSGGRATFCWLAANAIALMKQADQPAANSCSGLVPLPGPPGDDSLTSRRPSLVREAPSRPPVVCVLAVYSTFSIWLMGGSFFQWAMARTNHFSCQSQERIARLCHCVSYGKTRRQAGFTRFREVTKSRLEVPKIRRIVGMTEHRDSHPLFEDPKRLLLDM